MRRRTKIVLAITFMVAVLVLPFSYMYISQLLRQRIATAHETAAHLTIARWHILPPTPLPDLTSTRVNTNNPESVRRAIAYYLSTDRRSEHHA